MGWPKGKPRGPRACPGCQAKAARVAELEAEVARLGGAGPAEQRFFADLRSRLAMLTVAEREELIQAGERAMLAGVPKVLPPWQPRGAIKTFLEMCPTAQPAGSEPIHQDEATGDGDTPLESILPRPAPTSETVKAAIRNDLRRTIQSASALPAPAGARCSKHKRMGCPRCP